MTAPVSQWHPLAEIEKATTVQFTIQGSPVAAARARFARVGKGVRTYSPANNVAYSERVRDSFLQTIPDEQLRQMPFARGVPLSLKAAFIFARPKGHYGTGRNAEKLKPSAPDRHTTKPDVDNLCKLVKDALKGFAWHDDSQLCCYTDITKRYVGPGEFPRTIIEIARLDT